MKLLYVIDQEYDRQFLHMAENFNVCLFDDIYEKNIDIIETTRNKYQFAWEKINDGFSDYISRVTGYDWFYSEYTCVISVANIGISNWGQSNRILRGWKEDPEAQTGLTAHELILSHYFEIYRHHYTHLGLTDLQVWALSEIAAFALRSLTPESKVLWPKDSEYTTNHNYPQIVGLQKELKEIFLNRDSFDDYILAGSRLVVKL